MRGRGNFCHFSGGKRGPERYEFEHSYSRDTPRCSALTISISLNCRDGMPVPDYLHHGDERSNGFMFLRVCEAGRIIC